MNNTTVAGFVFEIDVEKGRPTGFVFDFDEVQAVVE